ncbi:MAG: PLD nuclease N-terminal domain-containing protein [Acidimicrobiales bacterium]
MVRFAPGLFGLFVFALWIWAVFDVIATDRVLVRNLDKTLWIMLVIFIPTVGAVAWLALGRPAGAGFTPGSTVSRPTNRTNLSAPAPLGIEDSPDWQARTKPSAPEAGGGESSAAKERRLLEWEAELAKRQAELEDPDDASD